jgi:hypothetical protein
MYQYQYPTFATPQTQNHVPAKQDPYLMTSPRTHLAIPNLSPGSFSSGASVDGDLSHGQQQQQHHHGSLSDDDGCPTPVLSPSLTQLKDVSSDETLVPRAYDTGPHEPIHLPLHLSSMPPQPYFSPPNKRQQRMAKLRARLWHNRPPTMVLYLFYRHFLWQGHHLGSFGACAAMTLGKIEIHGEHSYLPIKLSCGNIRTMTFISETQLLPEVVKLSLLQPTEALRTITILIYVHQRRSRFN